MLAENLKNIRKEHKLTQQEIANVLGLDRSTYAFYETGKTTPSVNTLYKLAEIYNVSIESFIDNETGVMSAGKVKEVPMSVSSPAADSLGSLDKNEKMLLMCYRLIDKKHKEKAIEMLKEFARNSESHTNKEYKDND